MSPRYSIITPTFERHVFLPLAYAGVCAQTATDWEWLIFDDSPRPSEFMLSLRDARVRYCHVAQRASLGYKRNVLCQEAKGEIIINFDDDDYYGPGYAAFMLGLLRDSDVGLAKLYGHYLYSKPYATFAYWDLTRFDGTHTLIERERFMPVVFDDNARQLYAKSHLGFGGTLAFRKSVWASSPYPDQDFNEDLAFIERAVEKHRIVGEQDTGAHFLRVMHWRNMSTAIPQYILPPFARECLFPGANPHVAIGRELA